MSAPIRLLKTAAEIGLAEQFAAARARGLGGAAMTRLRDDAFVKFERLGLPHRRVEAWHYTDLRALMPTAAPLAPAVSEQAIASLIRAKPADDGQNERRFFIVDGDYVPRLADSLAYGDAVKIRRLWDLGADELAIGDEFANEDAVVALNTALLQGGLVIDIAPGFNVPTPVHVIATASGGKARAVVHRTLVRVGAGASLTLIETSDVGRVGAAQENGLVQLSLGAQAQVTHVARRLDPGAGALQLASVIVSLGSDASYSSLALVSGAGIGRRQSFLRFNGSHARAALRGVALLTGEAHADTTLLVDHAAPHCVSRELFKHLVDDRATGVFQGKVIVRPGAQKTDGGMKSQALLLSQAAAMNNKPELEIFADDVICGHGATVGQLDRNQLFYLMSRGLAKPLAETLLLEAFVAEALETIADDELRARLYGDVRGWLARRRP